MSFTWGAPSAAFSAGASGVASGGAIEGNGALAGAPGTPAAGTSPFVGTVPLVGAETMLAPIPVPLPSGTSSIFTAPVSPVLGGAVPAVTAAGWFVLPSASGLTPSAALNVSTVCLETSGAVVLLGSTSVG